MSDLLDPPTRRECEQDEALLARGWFPPRNPNLPPLTAGQDPWTVR